MVEVPIDTYFKIIDQRSMTTINWYEDRDNNEKYTQRNTSLDLRLDDLLSSLWPPSLDDPNKQLIVNQEEVDQFTIHSPLTSTNAVYEMRIWKY